MEPSGSGLGLPGFDLRGLRDADGDDAPDVTSLLTSFVTIMGIGCGRRLALFLGADKPAISLSECACTKGSLSPDVLPSGLVVSTSMSSFSPEVLLTGSESTSDRGCEVVSSRMCENSDASIARLMSSCDDVITPSRAGERQYGLWLCSLRSWSDDGERDGDERLKCGANRKSPARDVGRRMSKVLSRDATVEKGAGGGVMLTPGRDTNNLGGCTTMA